MAKINLPKTVVKATQLTPKRTIIFSKPKVGKTVIASKLPKALMLDFEEGSTAIDAMSIQIKSYQDVCDVVESIQEEIKESGKWPYNFIVIDTASALEEMCLPQAELNYARSPEGKDWWLANEDGTLHEKSGKAKYGNIMHLGYGKGYQLVADVFNEVILKLEKCAPKMILLAHSTYATITKDDKEITSIDIQLAKKCKFTATFKADAIGYMYRAGKQNFINFSSNEDVVAGGRHKYLEKEPILISEFGDDEEIKTYWEKIYQPNKANQ